MPWCFLHSSDGRAAEILTAGLQQRAFVLPFAWLLAGTIYIIIVWQITWR
jgi:hypothetical protein